MKLYGLNDQSQLFYPAYNNCCHLITYESRDNPSSGFLAGGAHYTDMFACQYTEMFAC